MGLFRPARTVTSPTGDCWELYVSKTALPAWRAGNGDVPYTETMNAELDLVQLPLVIVSTLWSTVLLPLVRVCVLLPFAVVRGRRSRAIRIEAMKSFPSREVLLWTTTDGNCARVLDEVAAGLSSGKIVQPEGAVYSGAQ